MQDSPHQYLSEPILASRLQVAAGYLANKVAGRVILDINCGKAPLLEYLPSTFCSYIGNDTNKDNIEKCREKYPEGKWLQCSDNELPKLDRVDILVSLGFAARYSWAESETLDISIRQLIPMYRPCIVILEMWANIGESTTRILKDLISWIKERDYDLKFSWTLDSWLQPPSTYSRRGIVILEDKRLPSNCIENNFVGFLEQSTLQGIHCQYQELIDLYIPSEGRLLKTDCYNEKYNDTNFRSLSRTKLDSSRTIYLEIGFETCKRVKEINLNRNIVCGDIRSIPYKSNTFTCVIDLSTIDHIFSSEMPTALQEYYRIVVKGGRVIIAIWCNDVKDSDPNLQNPTNQHFIKSSNLFKLLQGFRILHYREIYRKDSHFLAGFVLEVYKEN